jgi:hypothetical protein
VLAQRDQLGPDLVETHLASSCLVDVHQASSVVGIVRWS